MQTTAIINHKRDNSFEKKTVVIDGEEYYISNSVPNDIEEATIDYHPDQAFALYIPNE